MNQNIYYWNEMWNFAVDFNKNGMIEFEEFVDLTRVPSQNTVIPQPLNFKRKIATDTIAIKLNIYPGYEISLHYNWTSILFERDLSREEFNFAPFFSIADWLDFFERKKSSKIRFFSFLFSSLWIESFLKCCSDVIFMLASPTEPSQNIVFDEIYSLCLIKFFMKCIRFG